MRKRERKKKRKTTMIEPNQCSSSTVHSRAGSPTDLYNYANFAWFGARSFFRLSQPNQPNPKPIELLSQNIAMGRGKKVLSEQFSCKSEFRIYQKNLRATTFSIFRLYGKNGKMYGINNLFRILFTSGTALIQITSIVRYALLRPQTWTKFMKILTDTKIGKKNRKKI